MEKVPGALQGLPARFREKSRLASGVSADALRSLKGLITPLGEKDVPPARRYLAKWWRQVQFALEGIDSSCQVEQLPRSTIERMGHVLLGEAAWELVGDSPFEDWEGFKETVEARFGMDEEHKEDLFTYLDIKPGEDGLDFIQRVEDTRVKLGFTHREALVKAWNCLPANITNDIRMKLDTLDRGKAKWSDVLRYANRRMAERESGAANAKLIPCRPTTEMASSSRPPSRPPPRNTRATYPPPPGPRGRPAKGQNAVSHEDHHHAMMG
jgi:hypothetical protein